LLAECRQHLPVFINCSLYRFTCGYYLDIVFLIVRIWGGSLPEITTRYLLSDYYWGRVFVFRGSSALSVPKWAPAPHRWFLYHLKIMKEKRLTKVDHLTNDADTLKEIIHFGFSVGWKLCFCAPQRDFKPVWVVVPVDSSCMTLLPWTLISHFRLCVAARILRSVLNRFN
jgi:hypothetical protein